MIPPIILEHAADLLDAEARGLRQSLNVGVNGDWSGEPEAKAVHDDFISTSICLRIGARRIRREAVAKMEKAHA